MKESEPKERGRMQDEKMKEDGQEKEEKETGYCALLEKKRSRPENLSDTRRQEEKHGQRD